jgi:hypothetical protein
LEKKKQHIIPECYQRAWCDPATPSGQEPFVWLIPRDDPKGGRRKSPQNALKEIDAYTVKLIGGTRNLIVEDSLAGIESAFSSLREVIGKRDLTDRERGVLCLFTAAMFSRTLDQRDNWTDNFTRLRDMTKAAEDAYNTNHALSNVADTMVQHAHPLSISWTLESMAGLLFAMTLTILEAADEVGFVTSDTPCMIMHPDTHKWPPMFRNPGLALPNTEVIMPISPRFCLAFSHYHWLAPQIRIPNEKLENINRATRRHSRAFIISRSREAKDCWFKEYELPADAWENTHKPDDLQINPLLKEVPVLPFERKHKSKEKE